MALESIALIPSGYKATKVYSQLPVNGNGDFTFDRGTSADQTRVNKNGLIESVAQDVPRLDYLDGGCPSLLLEPASTNLVTYSEEFDNAAWGKLSGGSGSAPVVTANTSLSPDGSVNADRVVFATGGSASGDQSFIGFGLSATSGVTYTMSFYIKSNTGSNQTLQWLRQGGIGDTFEVTNEWVRYQLTYQSTATSTTNWGLFIQGSVVTDADVLVWGGQIEVQSYATSYMPSLSGVSGVRDAETCNSAGTTAEINSQEGVLFAEIRALADDLSFRAISLSDTTTNNRVILYYSNTSNKIISDLKVGGGVEFGANHTLIDITKYTKIAVSYKENEFKLYVNGLLVDLDASGSVPSSGVFSELAFDDGAGGSLFHGRVKKLSVYDDTTQDLEQLTGFTSFAEMSSYLSYS